jgi:hypothetical protein
MAVPAHVTLPQAEMHQPRFHPVQFHPEFGYLAPSLRFRTKLSLLGKGAAFGIVAGIIIAIAVSPDRQEHLRSSLSIQSEAATNEMLAKEPIRFVAATLAMRDARASDRQNATLPVAESSSPSLAAKTTARPESSPRHQNARPKSKKKKIARRPRQERAYQRAETDPRSAYARASRRNAEPQAGWMRGRSYGAGW